MHFLDLVPDAVASDPSISIVGFEHPSDETNKCCLTGSVGAEQAKDLILFNYEVEASNCCEWFIPALLFVDLPEIVADQWILGKVILESADFDSLMSAVLILILFSHILPQVFVLLNTFVVFSLLLA